jgi:hypothetical protein
MLVNTIRLYAVLFMLSFAGSCRNPHPVATPTRLVALYNDVRVEPANWWIGIVDNTVDVQFHQKDIAKMDVTFGAKAPGIKIIKIERGDSDNYLCVTLRISPKAKPQKVPLVFQNAQTKVTFTHAFPILAPKGQ